MRPRGSHKETWKEAGVDVLDVFRLDPRDQDLSVIRGAGGGEGDEEEGDTTGDGCGASPPQGPTSGCLFPGNR